MFALREGLKITTKPMFLKRQESIYLARFNFQGTVDIAILHNLVIFMCFHPELVTPSHKDEIIVVSL
jgi:hypothetical protein